MKTKFKLKKYLFGLEEPILKIVALIIASILFINVLALISHLILPSFLEPKIKGINYLAKFGASLGGILGTLFSFITLLVLFYTILEQRAAQKKSDKIISKQLEMQYFQQFDSIFFNLLREVKLILPDNIEIGDCYEDIYFNIDNNSPKENIKKLVYNKKFSPFFILLYQLFKIIKANIHAESKEKERELQKKYANIVRAALPEKIMRLLLVNVLYDGFKNQDYKDFVEEFSFFEHISFDDDGEINVFLVYLAYQLRDIAFGKNIYRESFHNRFIPAKLIEKQNIYTSNDLLKALIKEIFIDVLEKKDKRYEMLQYLSEKDYPKKKEIKYITSFGHNYYYSYKFENDLVRIYFDDEAFPRLLFLKSTRRLESNDYKNFSEEYLKLRKAGVAYFPHFLDRYEIKFNSITLSFVTHNKIYQPKFSIYEDESFSIYIKTIYKPAEEVSYQEILY